MYHFFWFLNAASKKLYEIILYPELEEEEEKPSSSGGYHAIAFTYGNTGDSADQKDTNVEMEARGYVPPFSVPGDTVQSLVSSLILSFDAF